MKDPLKLKKIVFISGKGGAGKTTVTIAIAKLLADMGEPCLLIDLDLATHGSSYFFDRELGQSDVKGIWELLSQDTEWTIESQARKLPVRIEENFYFVSSRSKRDAPGPTYESVLPKLVAKNILNPLIEWASNQKIHYVLIDCQAGYSVATQEAVTNIEADSLIMVVESDSISNDAAESLILQLGYFAKEHEKSLPKKKVLTNMLDIQELEIYLDMNKREEFFKLMNQIPPIPFDFSVRKAFAKKELTLKPDKPSPFLFSLVRSLKDIMPELLKKIEDYENAKVNSLFKEYEKAIEKLKQRKEKIEKEKFNLRDNERQHSMNFRISFVNCLFILVLLIVFRQLAIVLAANGIRWINLAGMNILFLVAVVFVCIRLYISTFKWIFRLEKYTKDNDDKIKNILRELDKINIELDGYNSLILSISQKYYIDLNVLEKDEEEIDILT